jgi:hypothetical protein
LHVGGEFPIKVPSADGTPVVQMMPFGLQTEVRASILPDRRIRLQTSFKKSEQDLDHIVEVAGERVPSLSVHALQCETDSYSGQTLVIGQLSYRDRAAESKHDLREFIVLVRAELQEPPDAPPAVVPIPTELDPDLLRRVLIPAGDPDDLHFFPPTPIPRRGVLR